MDYCYKKLDNTSFAEQNLRRADFFAASLADADFSGADIRGTSFRLAYLCGANFDGAIYDEFTDFSGADFAPTEDVKGFDMVLIETGVFHPQPVPFNIR